MERSVWLGFKGLIYLKYLELRRKIKISAAIFQSVPLPTAVSIIITFPIAMLTHAQLYIHTYINKHTTVFLQKLTVSNPVKKFPTFY